MATQIRQITPYTGDVPVPGQPPAVLSQNSQDQLTFMNSMADELVNTISDMNDSADEMEENALKAESAANTAEAILLGNGYQGLWPDTGGSALKGDVWQTQVGGTPTGQYFIALQNTTVDPVADDVNWRVSSNLSTSNLSSYTDIVFDSVTDMISYQSHNLGNNYTVIEDGTVRRYKATSDENEIELATGVYAALLSIDKIPSSRVYANQHDGFGISESSSLSADYSFLKIDGYGFYSGAPTENHGWLATSNGSEYVEVELPFGVVVGDSIAEGHPDLHGRLHPNGVVGFDPNYPNENGQLSYNLGRLSGYYWYNHGIGGENTTQIWDRWDRDVLAKTFDPGDGRGNQTLSRKPMIVVISAGTNDISQLIPFEETKSNILNMLISCRENNIIPIFMNIGAVNIWDANQNKRRNQINEFMMKSIPTLGGFVFDYHTFIGNGGDTIAPDLHNDNVHPNKRGYMSLASRICYDTNAPIFSNIAIEDFSDPDNAPSSIANVGLYEVSDDAGLNASEHSTSNNSVSFRNNINMGNSRSIRISPKSFLNAGSYGGVSRVSLTLDTSPSSIDADEFISGAILKSGGSWSLWDGNVGLSNNGIKSVSTDATGVIIETNQNFKSATLNSIGGSLLYAFSITILSSNQFRINFFNSSFAGVLEPSVLDNTAISITGH